MEVVKDMLNSFELSFLRHVKRHAVERDPNFDSLWLKLLEMFQVVLGELSDESTGANSDSLNHNKDGEDIPTSLKSFAYDLLRNVLIKTVVCGIFRTGKHYGRLLSIMCTSTT